MQLAKVEFRGYKRLRSTEVNVDAPLVAILGPNEAGKTSLLDAMALLSGSGPLSQRELSRGLNPNPRDPIVSGWFRLEPDDRELLARIPEATRSRWMVVQRLADGSLVRYLYPRVDRDKSHRQALRVALSALGKAKWSSETLSDNDDEQTIAEAVLAVAPLVVDEPDTLPVETLDVLRGLQNILRSRVAPPSASKVIERIDRLTASEQRPHPRDQGRDALMDRIPQLLKFDIDDRGLASEYDLDTLDLNDLPAALENLCILAGLDVVGAVAAVRAGEYGTKLKMIKDANVRLDELFRSAWPRAETVVQLDMDETQIRIFVSNPGGGYSAIAERSEGLRSFVALIAFTALSDEEVRPILLIDEAETHLHYDAQADLIRVLTRQQAASKVIYTTHSAGCLPEDLGTGIRLVDPIPGSDASLVSNSFWTKGGGFANLLVGMGASALAFASTRYALIAEGGADLILLPTLLREACKTTYVGFQVAPGLAEATPAAIAELDLSAARVAYVVDDDTGGRAIARKLRGAGISGDRIIVLGRGKRSGLVLEDTLQAAVYANCVNAELELSGISERVPIRHVRAKGRPARLDQWASEQGTRAPNRTAIATRVLAVRNETNLLSPAGARVLRDLAADARSALGIPAPD